jgi:predicted RNA binding protein YcfA (HicA-like mRNA interferase family)
MNRAEKLKARLLSGKGYHNFSFGDLVMVLELVGFVHVRTNGSHRFFSHPSIPEPVNIQPRDGKCKPYQLKQVRDIIKEHGL